MPEPAPKQADEEGKQQHNGSLPEPAALSLMVSDGKKAQLEELGGVLGLARKLGANPEQGLSDKDVDRMRASHGRNVLPDPIQTSFFQFVKQALADPMLILLIISAVISLALGMNSHTSEDTSKGWLKGTAIMIAVSIVVLTSSINDYQKEKQFRRLNAIKNDRKVNVKRNGGKTIQLNINDVVVGDVLLVEGGDKVPADGVFLSGSDITVDESGATGEPDTMRKGDPSVPKASPFFISGTQVLSGYGRMLVVAVGETSFHGKTMMSLRTGRQMTPLQEKLAKLADKIGRFGVYYATFTFLAVSIKVLIEASQSDDGIQGDIARKLVDVLIIAVTIIVVAVPEGLPLAVTISLAYSMMRMIKDNNLVKHFDACETMGGATTICSDKTGTLTQNRMTVVDTWLVGSRKSLESAADLQGTIAENAQSLGNALSEQVRATLIDSVSVNSTAYANTDPKGKEKEPFIGNKSECAMLGFIVSALGADPTAARAKATTAKVVPFSSARKRMSTVMESTGAAAEAAPFTVHCKGASEVVLRLCTHVATADGGVKDLDAQTRAEVEGVIEEMASGSLRTMALAYRPAQAEEVNEEEEEKGEEPDGEGQAAAPLTPLTEGGEAGRPEGGPEVVVIVRGSNKEEQQEEEKEKRGPVEVPPEHPLERNLVLLGVVGIRDPLRPEVKGAVKRCQDAGVRVVMVTGDNLTTAKNIATSAGILTEGGEAMEGSTFRELTPEKMKDVVARLQVLARSSPTDKQLLVRSIKALGEVVAVTGDGTNDAPALKLADVGFAMGISGTEVAREAADVVLMDDNFASIVKAIMWGRNVFDGIRSFLQFQLTVNVVAIILTLIGALTDSNGEPPLSAVQLLWINLIMDTLAALALATQPPTMKLLDFQPYGKQEPLITRLMWRSIGLQALYQLTVNLVLLYAGHEWFDVEKDSIEHKTIVFNTFVFMQLFNEINARKIHHEKNVFDGIQHNKFFMGVMLVSVVCQAVFVELTGDFTNTSKLSAVSGGWPVSIALGAGGMLVGLLHNLLPAPAEPKTPPAAEYAAAEQAQPPAYSESKLSFADREESTSLVRLKGGVRRVEAQLDVLKRWRNFESRLDLEIVDE